MQKDPKPIGDSIHELLDNLGIAKKINQHQIKEQWPELVGPKVAAISKPERIMDNILYIRVQSMTWRTELIFQKHLILKKIEDKVGKGVIVDIRFC